MLSADRLSCVRYGRYNTVRQLLDSEKGSFIINESDGEGLTPLHIASQQGEPSRAEGTIGGQASPT